MKHTFRTSLIMSTFLVAAFIGVQVAQAVWQDNTAAPPGNNVQFVSYSKTCSDWSIKGWKNVNDCLQDGRWHAVSSSAVSTHGTAGADIRVVTSIAGNTFTTFCTITTLAGAGVLECSDPVHFGIGQPSSGGALYWGASVWMSDGRIYESHTQKVSAGSSFNTHIITTDAYSGASISWFIRY